MRKKTQRSMPEISTASLPDIIFMLLFFFMVVTVMRTNDQQLPIELPQTVENDKVKKIDKEVSLQVSGSTEKILVNDQYVSIDNLGSFLELATADIHRADRINIPVYLRVDKGSPMGTVYAVKLALRKVGLRKVNYIVKKKVVS